MSIIKEKVYDNTTSELDEESLDRLADRNMTYTRVFKKPCKKKKISKRSQGTDNYVLHLTTPSIIWLPFILCVALLFMVVGLLQLRTYSAPISTFRIVELEVDKTVFYKNFLIDNAGCKIPDMNAFDGSVMKFIFEERRANCSWGKPPLYEMNDTSLYLVHAALQSHGIRDVSDLVCCYTPFWRKNPLVNESDDKIVYSSECKEIDESRVVTDEFVKLTCNYCGLNVYTDYYAFVPLKPNVSAVTRPPEDEENASPNLNVLVIGMDTVSRLNLHRQMPKTVQYLKNLSAIELLGYNKVGDETFPNLIPVLTGLSVSDLWNNCWRNSQAHFDDCPFIWKLYKQKGFVTCFAEDSAALGMFNFEKKGFIKQPVDYAYSNFNQEVEKQIGHTYFMNIKRCVGPREVYKTSLDYIGRFVRKMHSAKWNYFAFFWMVSLGHDSLNAPKLGDEDYKILFEKLKENGKLENTVLIFMSDHGMRWGDIRRTYQGRLEERLPFVYVVLPNWLKHIYPTCYKNLLTNTRRLTTPFDLHETMVHLLNFSEGNLRNAKKKRGYSLFSEISPNRTCADAAIASHWCTCQQSHEVDKNNSSIHGASQLVVDHMNLLLESHTQCSILTLKSIVHARLISYNKYILSKQTNFKDYIVTIETEPGGGVFESTVRDHAGEDDSYFEIIGTISRLNVYGKQSYCIADFRLKLYCYCDSDF